MKTHSFAAPAALLLVATAALLPAVCHASQAGKEFADTDADMNKAYQAAMAKIKDASQRALFVAAQKAWLKYRDDSVAFFAAHYPSSKGGLFYNIHLMRERTTFLQAVATSAADDDEGEKASGY